MFVCTPIIRNRNPDGGMVVTLLLEGVYENPGGIVGNTKFKKKKKLFLLSKR